MALEAGVPVIPVAMIGTDKVNPIGSRMWRPHQVHIRIGAPLDFSRYAGDGRGPVHRALDDRRDHVRVDGAVRAAYVDIYAASVKERAAAADAARLPDSRAG